MTNNDKNRDEKLKYDINKEAEIISALSPGKIDKYEYLTGEEIQPSDQRKVIQQTKFQKLLKHKPKRLKRTEKRDRCCYKSKQKMSGFNQ